jgi:hypothetical protein
VQRYRRLAGPGRAAPMSASSRRFSMPETRGNLNDAARPLARAGCVR